MRQFMLRNRFPMKTSPKIILLWLLLIILGVVALAAVLVPAWLIQPFRPQTARDVELSYRLKTWAPMLTALAAVVALALAFPLWHAGRGVPRKIALLVVLIPIFAAVWFARENHFEWMFNPLPNVRYARAGEANFISDKDMVMAVQLGGDAVAYPIGQMAYHHVVNDVVGGKPITATY